MKGNKEKYYGIQENKKRYANSYKIRNPSKIQKKEKDEKKKEPIEKEELLNNLLTHFQKMHMPKINQGPGLVPKSAVVVTGKYKEFNVNLDVIITSKQIEVTVFAEYVNDHSKVIKKKVYDFNYPVEFPITSDTLGKLDLTEAGVTMSNDPLQTLRNYLYDAKHKLPQDEENLPVYNGLDVLTSNV